MIHHGYMSNLLLIFASMTILSNGQVPPKSNTNDGDYNTLHRDGSYEFGYNNNDDGASYHLSQANRANVVRGRFGSRDPSTGGIKETIYTAGPRGFRARGPNIHRKMDLDQRPRGPIGNKDDPFFDPNEDPSYSFGFKTPTYDKQEAANRRGDVSGRYSYVDDVGERHNVEYIAGKDTGFHVKTAYPDSSPGSIGPLFYNGPLVRGEKKARGHTSIQRGLDGSYRFISAGPDQRRTESSDANGNVRGSYSFLDDKGVQRTVHYIAGPGIGYRVVKNSKDPYIPTFFPSLPDYRDPTLNKPYVPPTDDFNTDNTFPNKEDDDLFGRPGGSAASGHVKPPANGNRKPGSDANKNDDDDDLDNNNGFDNNRKPDSDKRPTSKPGPSIDSDFGGQDEGKPIIYGENDDDDLFGKPPSRGDDNFNIPNNINNNIHTGSDNNGEDDDDIFGPKPGGRPSSGNRPTSKPNRPISSGRPTNNGRPNNGGRPGNAGRPINRPSTRPDSVKPTGSGGRPDYGATKPDTDNTDIHTEVDNDINKFDSGTSTKPSNGRPTNGNRPSNKPTTTTRPNGNGNNGRPSNNGRPGGYRPTKPTRPISSGRPDTGSRPGFDNINTGSDSNKHDGDGDDDIFGPKPGGSSNSGYDKKPGSGIRPGSSNRPNTDDNYTPDKPLGPPIDGTPIDLGPSSGSGFLDGTDDDDDDGGHIGYGGNSGNLGGGSNINSGGSSSGIGGSGTIGGGTGNSGGSSSSGGTSSSHSGIDKDDKNKKPEGNQGSQINISGSKGGKHRGGTIFRNVGEESINFPPGASVRAHVQSIDILPFGTKTRTPGEAVEDELKKHGSR